MKITTKYRKREGRCYELSFRTQQKYPECFLVHGVLTKGEISKNPLPHAWLEYEGIVYDVVLNKTFQKENYYLVFGAQPTLSYSATDAAFNLLSHKHSGPWQETDSKEN